MRRDGISGLGCVNSPVEGELVEPLGRSTVEVRHHDAPGADGRVAPRDGIRIDADQ